MRKRNIHIKTGAFQTDVEGIGDFFQRFPTEESAIECFINFRWEGKITCPYCEEQKIYKIQNGKRYRCGSCKRNFTWSTGSFAHGTKLKAWQWLLALMLISSHKKGYTSIQLARDIKTTQDTAYYVLSKIREIFFEEPDDDPLNGIVEMDEAFIGRNRALPPGEIYHKRGAGSDRPLIIGAIERSGRVFAIPMCKDEKKQVADIFAKRFIAPDANLMTDGSPLYKNFKDKFPYHGVVVHSDKNSPTRYVDGINHTNNIERFWRNCKSGIRITYHSVTEKKIDQYVYEYTFRYNYRNTAIIDKMYLVVKKGEGKRFTKKWLKGKIPRFLGATY